MLYVILSVLFLIIVPFLLELVLAVVEISNGVTVGYFYIVWSIAVYVVTAYWYARMFLSQNKIRRPKTLIGFFMPLLVLLCFGMWMFIFGIAEKSYDYDAPMIYLVLALLNFWQTIMYLVDQDGHVQMHSALLIPLTHLASMFAAWGGYRVTLRKGVTERLTVPVKKCVALITGIVLLLAGCIYGKWYTDMTTPSAEGREDAYFMRYGMGTANGYGFPYEDGWSSVDLWPYHVENQNNRLAVLEEASELTISGVNKMPVLDGAEAAYPVYAAFANACYQNIAEIQAEESGKKPIAFTNTIEAYKSLLAGETDIFFGAELSDEQLRMAEEAGKELIMTPIGREAFVFFVSMDNPVDGLSSEQIRNIYSGKTRNWFWLGGRLMPILAYQRPENSGSQTRMQYFMGDTPLKEPMEIEFEISMYGAIHGVADYENRPNAIGYSFRFYAEQMANDTEETSIKLLTLDEIAPTIENIQNGTYPMSGTLMAITLADNPNPEVSAFVEWMTGEQGQTLVEQTGYVRLS